MNGSKIHPVQAPLHTSHLVTAIDCKRKFRLPESAGSRLDSGRPPIDLAPTGMGLTHPHARKSSFAPAVKQESLADSAILTSLESSVKRVCQNGMKQREY